MMTFINGIFEGVGYSTLFFDACFLYLLVSKVRASSASKR